MSEINFGLLKALAEKGLISHAAVDSAMAGEKVALPDVVSMKDKYLARFGEGTDDEAKAIQGLQQASQSGQPYAHTGAISGLPTQPNFDYKITQPGQTIGHSGIMEPFNNKLSDPLPWSDDKYQVTKNALLDAKQNNIPVNINTSSDLIAKDDYINALPRGSSVNLYLPTNDWELNRDIFPGNPSRQRLQNAAQKLKESGINVNMIEPTPDSIKQAISNKTNSGSLKFGAQADPDYQKYINDKLNDPRTFYSGPKLVNGVIPAGITSPLALLGQGAQKYNDIKNNIYEPLAKQLNLSGNPQDTKNITQVLSTVGDPINAIPGIAGIGAQALQGVAESQSPSGMAFGGNVKKNDPPPGLEDFISQPVQAPQDNQTTTSEPLAGLEQFVAPELNQEKFGSVPQQALAGLEGVARGVTFGGSDILEPKIFPTTKENIKAREEANPATSIIGNIAGSAIGIGATEGLGLLPEALGPGSAAAKGALEGAALGAGNAISDQALGDSDLNAQNIATQVGLGAVLGLGGGFLGNKIESLFGKSGAVKGSIPDVISNEIEASNRSAKTAAAISEQAGLKPTASDIAESANALGAPLLEGQVSDNPFVQKLEDSLINGAPTISGLRKANLYNTGYNIASQAAEDILPMKAISKNQFGGILQDSLSSKIADEAAPFNELYSTIKETTQDIPLNEKSAPSIAKNIREIVNDPSIGKNSPAAKLGSDIADEIADLKTVDDLRGYQSSLNNRLSAVAPPSEKRIIGLISEKLDNWEQRTIRNYASNLSSKVDMSDPEQAAIWGPKIDRINSLLSNIDEADTKYSAFRKKINELSDWLGKGKVYGAKDAMNFISERLEPEDLINKLSSKKYAGLYDFMDKNFPEEGAVVKEYQKAALRDAATKDGSFNVKTFLRKFDDLEPEIQKSIFSSDELDKINHIKNYVNALPRNFNPSGTSGMSALRHFFESPVSAATSNARDFGIDQLIKTLTQLPENYRPNPVEYGAELAQKFNHLNAAKNIADKTTQELQNSVKSLLGYGGTIAAIGATTHSFEEKKDRIKELSQSPETLMAQIQTHTGNISNQLPNISQGIATTAARSVSYLKSQLPQAKTDMPLSQNFPVSNSQKQKFNRIYDAVDNPISVLKFVKDGTVTLDQIQAIQATKPELYQHMKSQIIQMANPEKAKALPYKTKQGIALFLGQPLDESMLQSVRLANQAVYASTYGQNQQQQAPQSSRGSGKAKSLKLSERLQTQTYRTSEND